MTDCTSSRAAKALRDTAALQALADESLRAEVERLRTALERIAPLHTLRRVNGETANKYCIMNYNGSSADYSCLDQMKAAQDPSNGDRLCYACIARAALQPQADAVNTPDAKEANDGQI